MRTPTVARTITALLLVGFLSSCDTSIREVVQIARDVTGIVFIERDKHRAHVITSVNEPDDIRQIIDGISVGEEQQPTRRVFAKHIVFLRGEEKYFSISIDHNRLTDSYTLRYRAKQYETSRETYELLAGYFGLAQRGIRRL